MNGAFADGSLNTLAQTETVNLASHGNKRAVIVSGNGSDVTDSKALKGRAKRKMITQKMILSLIDVCKTDEEVDKQKSYWNTYHCLNRFYLIEGRLHGQYCKNRFCTVCCSIRKADIINRYMPVISEWPNPYFVTLTVKAVRLAGLAKRIRSLNNGFRIISSLQRKRALRGKGIKLVGIKSLECNFNPTKKTYNPHLHLIVENKQMAEIIISEWLRICTLRFAVRNAQNMQPATDTEKALIEIVKYGSKIFTEPDVATKATRKTDRDIYAAALNNIFTAMKGCRIFERFGFNLPQQERQRKISVATDYQEWIFDDTFFDWIQAETGNPLSGFCPQHSLVNLLEYNINKELE
jgi:hypothetical protein